jgi:hypothetical protein
MYKDHYKSLRGEFRKVKSVESEMKYVGSKFFPGFVVNLWSSANEWDDFDPNHTKYEPQLVYHEPQLEKFEIRVNHNLEPRRPIKTYRIWSETLEWTHQMCLIHS